MSLINVVIPKQNFEYVIDRIGEILTDELNNQYTLTYDEDLQVDVFKERSAPFGPEECPAVNVMLWKGDYDSKTIVARQGLYRFIIECTGIAPSEDGDTQNESRGDTLSMTRIQKLMGVIMSILENPVYKTLGFANPYIGGRTVEGFHFMKHPNQDANNVSIGRIVFAVQVHETYSFVEPTVLAQHDTGVRLGLTDKGFKWVLY